MLGVAMVRPGRFVNQRRTLGQCGLHVDDGRQRLVVDLDRLDGIGRQVTIGGQHDCNAIPDMTDLTDRQGRELRHHDVRRRPARHR